MIFILFQIENQTWCVELQWVREVVKGGIDKPLPNARFMIEGMKNVRGEIVPVVSGANLIDDNNPNDLNNDVGTGKILLIEYGGVLFGLSVNLVQGVEDMPVPSIDKDGREDVPQGIRQEFVAAYIKSTDNKKIPLLDIKRLSRLITERQDG